METIIGILLGLMFLACIIGYLSKDYPYVDKKDDSEPIKGKAEREALERDGVLAFIRSDIDPKLEKENIDRQEKLQEEADKWNRDAPKDGLDKIMKQVFIKDGLLHIGGEVTRACDLVALENNNGTSGHRSSLYRRDSITNFGGDAKVEGGRISATFSEVKEPCERSIFNMYPNYNMWDKKYEFEFEGKKYRTGYDKPRLETPSNVTFKFVMMGRNNTKMESSSGNSGYSSLCHSSSNSKSSSSLETNDKFYSVSIDPRAFEDVRDYFNKLMAEALISATC